jgi:hypothetical protein
MAQPDLPATLPSTQQNGAIQKNYYDGGHKVSARIVMIRGF